MRGAKFAVFILLCAPLPAGAQVLLSEILYDLETGADAGREWVEVWNSGSATEDVGQWRLFENGSNHQLTAYSGSGVLAPGAYAVIADDPAKFLADWPSYTGPLFDSAFSLSNSGETLILRCCGSDLADKDLVAYTPSAQAGESLHRNAASGTLFIAAAPSPGAGSLGVVAGKPDEAETASAPSPGGSVSSGPSVESLSVFAGADRYVVTGANIVFTAQVLDEKKRPFDMVHVQWNFGDGAGATGRSVTHVFEYPGRYAITVSATHYDRSASDQAVVVVEEASVRLVAFPDGSISVENRAARELDLSGWSVSEGTASFTFPAGTLVLPGASVRLSKERTRLFASGRTILNRPDGSLGAAIIANDEPPALIEEEEPPRRFATERTAVSSALPAATDLPAISSSVEAVSQKGQVAAANILPERSRYWFGAAAVAVLGVGAVLAGRRLRDEWTIIEETGSDA